MSEYDSILKEKKKYKETAESQVKKKKFPCLKMDLFAVLVVLCVSYVVYYQKILAPDKIFMWNLSKVFMEYNDVIKHVKLDSLMNDSYQLGGDLSLGEDKYHYDVIRKDNIMKADFGNRDNYLLYYIKDNNNYIKLSGMEDKYIKLDSNIILNSINSIKDNFLKVVSLDKYIKRFYMDGTIPIVEANLTLKNEDIKNILKISKWQENIEVLFTFKNHAFTNEIINMKVVINDLNSNERKVINYNNGEINYNDDKLNLKFLLKKNKEDFTLKIYQSDIIYSVLSGIKKEDTYQYMYQVIDEIYNITLNVKEDSNIYYEFISNIETDDKKIQDKVSVTMLKNENVTLDNIDLSNILEYSNFTEEEKNKYNTSLDSVIGNLREFIKKYQSSVEDVDNNNSDS